MNFIKNNIRQFFKFGIVGFINTFNSWIIYYSLVFLNVNYLISTTIAYFLSSIIGYMLNKKWVFKNKENHNKVSSLVKYYAVYVSSYFLNLLCMYVFVDVFGISKLFAPILVLFITVPYNYIFSKLWVFASKNKEKQNLDHTFAICAYKESKYLEKCVISLKNQTLKTNIIMCTSTPNDYIKNIAKRYDIPLFIKTTKSDICDDWNFAYNKANTNLVTIAHQDDIYEENYAKRIVCLFSKYQDSTIAFTDYYVLKNNKKGSDTNSFIKKIIKLPLLVRWLAKFKFFKVASLSLGNSINCPSVSYNKKILGNSIFTSELKFGLDWDTFLKLARQKGRFLYLNENLISYRIHDEATTKEFIINNKRKDEDIIMFNKIWPNFISKLIMKVYIKSYDTYGGK